MKKIVVVSERHRISSNNTGQPQPIFLSESLMTQIGGSDTMNWEATVYALSSANAQLDIAVYEGTKSNARPSMNMFAGKQIGSPIAVTGLGLTDQWITNPYRAVVDAVFGVRAITGTTLEWMEVEIRVTLTYK